jgi:DNA-directed RNA polymerase specialized sigma24 family protein
MNETFSFLIGPATSVVAGLVFFFLVRREGRRTAVLIQQMERDFHFRIDEQVRRLQQISEPSRLPPRGAKEHAAGERDRFLDLVENLPEPHKTIFEMCFLHEADPDQIARTLDLTKDEVHAIYEEAAAMVDERHSAIGS